MTWRRNTPSPEAPGDLFPLSEEQEWETTPLQRPGCSELGCIFPRILVFLCPGKDFDVAVFQTIVETIVYFSKSKELVYYQAPG